MKRRPNLSVSFHRSSFLIHPYLTCSSGTLGRLVSFKNALDLGSLHASGKLKSDFGPVLGLLSLTADAVLDEEGSQSARIFLPGHDDKTLAGILNFQIALFFFFRQSHWTVLRANSLLLNRHPFNVAAKKHKRHKGHSRTCVFFLFWRPSIVTASFLNP